MKINFSCSWSMGSTLRRTASLAMWTSLPLILVASMPLAHGQDRDRGDRRGGADRGGERDGRGGGDRGGDRGGRFGGGRPTMGGRPGMGGPGGGTGGDPTMGLLMSEAVRKEIKVDDEQMDALKKLAESARDRARGDFDFRSASEEERREYFEKMREKQSEQAEELKADLEFILLPDQMERLQQISIQVRGMMALMDPEVAEAIGLSEAQVKELGTVRDEASETMRTKMQEMFASGDREGIREKLESMRSDVETQVLDVLTDDQRKKFEELKGDPFDVSQISRGGAGGRPGMGGGPGGGRGGPGGGRGGFDGGRGGFGGGGDGRRAGGRERPSSED